MRKNENPATPIIKKTFHRCTAHVFHVFIAVNIAVIIIFLAGTLIYSERLIAEAFKTGESFPFMEMKRVDSPQGIKIDRHMNFLLPGEIGNAWRSFNIERQYADSSWWDYLDNLEYIICLQDEEGYISASYEIGGFFRVFKQLFVALLIWELVYLLFEFIGNMGKARRELRRLPDISGASATLEKEIFRNEESLAGLAGKIAKIDAYKLNTRISAENCQKELLGIVGAINKMLEDVENVYSRQNAFVSDASHELRTPISVIQGYINLLDRWGKSDEKTLQESIDAIKIESERMRRLVESLLFLARGDVNSLELNYTDVNVGILVNEALKEAEMIDASHKWSLKSETDEDTFIKADIAMLKQALRVLTDNARQYTPEGGSIEISAKQNGNDVLISVQDSGIGIPAADISYIFDRFYRSDPSRERRRGGSGLGLSIAKWIIDKHGGRWDILSREGLGTRMTIILKRYIPPE